MSDDDEVALMQRRLAEMRALDISGMVAIGCSRGNALEALHKARYECTAIEPELRHASRQWLQDHGFTRIHRLPWPENNGLPGGE